MWDVRGRRESACGERSEELPESSGPRLSNGRQSAANREVALLIEPPKRISGQRVVGRRSKLI